MTATSEFDVCVVGGGIAGISCALKLQEHGISALILEKETTLGGRIRTVVADCLTVETGASFFVGFYDDFNSVIDRASLTQYIHHSTQETWLCRSDDKAAPIWPVRQFFLSKAISFGGKLRALPGLLRVVAQACSIHGYSVYSAHRFDSDKMETWGTRTFGKEFYDSIIGPLFRALFFLKGHETSNALIPLILKSVMREPHFYTLGGGMESLASSLEALVESKTNTEVEKIEFRDNAFRIVSDVGENLTCRAVVLATPACKTSKILTASGIDASNALKEVRYTKVVVGIIKLNSKVDSDYFDGKNMLFPVSPPSPLISAKVFSNGINRYLRFYWDPDLSEDELKNVGAIVKCLRDNNQPTLSAMISGGTLIDLHTWETAIPIFTVGSIKNHSEDSYSERLPRGVFLAGDYLKAPHLEGATSSGFSAARTVAQYLHKSTV